MVLKAQYKLDSEGCLVDIETGERIKRDNGDPYKVAGSVDQDYVDKLVSKTKRGTKEELEQEHQEQLKKILADKERDLAAAAEKDKATLTQQIAALEAQLSDKEKYAQERANNARAEAEKRLAESQDAVRNWEKRWRQDRLTTDLVAVAAANNFINARDLVEHLAPRAKWLPVLDESGKPTGEQMYKITYPMVKKDESGKETIEDRELSAEEAAKVVAENKTYLVRGSNTGGTGNMGGIHSKSPNADEVPGLVGLYAGSPGVTQK